MSEIHPYLLLKNTKKALEYYQKVFDAKIEEHHPYTKEIGESAGFPKDFEYENSTMHCQFSINGQIIYAADDLQSKGNDAGRVDIMLEPENREQQALYYERAVKHGCTVDMKLEETYWGAIFARFLDPFGVGWQMNLQIDQD